MNYTKGKKYGKLLLDLLLLMFLSLMYRKQAISMRFHEIGGLVICGLFAVHMALDRHWICGAAAGIFQRKARPGIRWTINVLLLLSLISAWITGLLISKTLPTGMENSYEMQTWHFFSAAALLGLSGIHLGLHASWLQKCLWSRLPLPEGAGRMAGAVFLCAVFCFGSYCLVSTGFLSWFTQPLAGITTFREEAFVAFSEPVPQRRQTAFWEGGNGSEKGTGAGRETGMEENRMKQSLQAISPVEVVQTAAVYASILAWFAIVTALLETWFRRRKTAGTQRNIPIGTDLLQLEKTDADKGPDGE